MSTLPFYHSTGRQAALIEEAKSWAGTPFRENCSVKGQGGGVDCSRFALAVHQACGAVGAVQLDVLPVEWVRSWHVHHAQSRMVDFFNQPGVRERLKRIDHGEPRLPGDLIACKVGLTEHHVGLWLGDEVAHVQVPAGVIFTSCEHPELKKIIRSTYRIFEEPNQ